MVCGRIMVSYQQDKSFESALPTTDLMLAAGSDVAHITTTAERQGNFYLINGAKKWITNSIWADYCTTAVRTGEPGAGGISLIIIPLASKGVTRRKMENSGVSASGSTYLEFDDVKVAIENLLGQENSGFRYIMSSKYISIRMPSMSIVGVIVKCRFQPRASHSGWFSNPSGPYLR